MLNRLFLAAGAALLLTAGIAPAHASHGINGAQINGAQINGAQINGAQINGAQINGAQINGNQQNALTFNGIAQIGESVRELNGVRAESVTLPADAAR